MQPMIYSGRFHEMSSQAQQPWLIFTRVAIEWHKTQIVKLNMQL